MDTNDKGYKDTKEFICTGCGKKIILTKFASQKTCRCDDCKTNNIPVNPDIVSEALKSNPPKERKKSDSGSTKILPCIKCGTMTEVSKFMSASKVLCDNCKGTSVGNIVRKLEVDKSKLGLVNIAPMEEYEINDGVIANRRLREIKCPKCGHEYMKPLSILDWSQFGLIVHYQCQECYLLMNISEQCKRQVKIYSTGKRFDYTGRQIKELGMNYVDSSRLANALITIIQKCEENNIDIDDMLKEFSDTVPPYRFKEERPVDSGFEIPQEDIWIDAVHSAYELLKNASCDGNIDSNKSKAIADKLNRLLKGENEDARE